MRKHTFAIRRGRSADLDALDRLNRELQTHERQLRPTRRPARALPRSYVEALLRRDRRNAGRLFVATAAGGVIAFLACALESDILESHPLAVAISDLVVTRAWRRRGVAAALIDSAEGFARANHAYGLRVATLVQNALARRAYRALRFSESYVSFERRVRGSRRVRQSLGNHRTRPRRSRT